jgi:hypothetical protein
MQESQSQAGARSRRDVWIVAALMLLGVVILGARAIPYFTKPTLPTQLGTVQDARAERHQDTGARILALKVRLDDGRIVDILAPAEAGARVNDRIRVGEKTSDKGARMYVWAGPAHK